MKIRNSSRITALVLALVMLLPLISIPTFAADYTAEDILWSEDFSSYEGIDNVYAAKNNTHFFNSGGPKNMEAVTENGNTYLRFPMEIMLSASGGTFDGQNLALVSTKDYKYWHKQYPNLVADISNYNADTNELTFVNTNSDGENLTVTLDREPEGADDFVFYGQFTHTDGYTYRVATPNFAYVAWVGDGNVVDKYAQLYFGEREVYTAEDPEVAAGTQKVGDLKPEPTGYSYKDYDKIVLTYKAMIESNSHGILNMQLNHFSNASNPTAFDQNFLDTGNLDLDTGKWSDGCFDGVTFPKDEWFDLYFVIDLDAATIEGIYNGKSRGVVSCGKMGTGGIVVNSWTISKIYKAAYFDGIDGAWCIDDVKVLVGDVANDLAKFTNYSNDFESQNVGDTIGGFVSAHASSKVVADPAGTANKVWKLVDSKNGGANNNNKQKVNSDVYKASYGDNVTLTVDYYIPSGTATQLQTQFHQITGKTAGTEATKAFGDIYIIKSTTDGVLTLGRETHTNMYALNYDEWFTVAVEFTMSTNTYDVYVNNNLAFGGQKILTFDSLTVFPAQSIFVAKENSAAENWVSGPTYIDNITLKAGMYDAAFSEDDTWTEDVLYEDAYAWDLDNAEVATQNLFAANNGFSFPNSLIFVDADEDTIPDAIQLDIKSTAVADDPATEENEAVTEGAIDKMVRPKHVGVSAKKASTVVLSANYTVSEDAEGTIELQLHEVAPIGWYLYGSIDCSKSTINGVAFTKGEEFNVTVVLEFATGTIKAYYNNLLIHSATNVAMVKNGLSEAEWSVAKIMKDCEAYAGSIIVDDMTITGKLADDKSENVLYLYDQENMVAVEDLVETVDAASIRLFAPTGLRFAAKLNNASVLSSATKIGMLIAPAQYVTDAGAFTKEALETLPYVTTYLDIEAEVGNYFKGNGTTANLGEGEFITASIVNILDKNITRDFAAIAYVEVAGQIYYASEYTVANVQEIAQAAQAAYADTVYANVVNAYANGVKPAY